MSELVQAQLAAAPEDGCRRVATVELLNPIGVVEVFRKDPAFDIGVTE